MTWRLVFTRQAQKDARKISRAGLKSQTVRLLEILKKDPYRQPYEKLLGDLIGSYSRRINIQHRLVYQILVDIKTVKIIRLWTHYK